MSSEMLQHLENTAAITGPGAAAATVTIKVLLYGLIFFLWRTIDACGVARNKHIQPPEDYCTEAFQGQFDALAKEIPECWKDCQLSQIPKDNFDEQNSTDADDFRNINSNEFDCPRYLKDATQESRFNLFSNADTFQLLNEVLSKSQAWFLMKKRRIFKHIEHANLYSILLAN